MRAHLSLLLATTNRGKLLELAALFKGMPIEIVSATDVLPGRAPVLEDGATFEENALIKARSAAKEAMMLTLADDSGLEVDALGGRPGVRSARFAKEGATDAENNAELLLQLQEVDDEQRTARFRCAMVVIDPWGDDGQVGKMGPAGLEIVTEGRCEGTIARQSRGNGGFGYDPLFIVNGFGRTMAELDEEEKNRISHRARAAAAMFPLLSELIKKRVGASARLLGAR